ncbi:D-alanyl-D-alanine carboxypeptidase family protein [Thermosyntropha sp.]|uniref:D-alanyl-D-alanine carboxypeptidase family protein n=1 Tax=Thermosyntropha sp. TaxID=2740820 RepID=UPI0025E0AE6D|nr:D-alanyl-D-alanine carboxypeptidase family protein [Thermosyntropha sp.]MBO8158315.1 D-alanyl-D-alanine carboxypeptidase [Thermosyntropha sp.]
MKRIVNLIKINLFFCIIALVLFLSISTVYAIPLLYSNYYCLVDGDSGQIIVSKNADQKREVASTTKMMTAILAEEYCSMDEMATVSYNAARTHPFTIGLREGQKLKIEELLKAALIRSSNDAAVVLAEHVAGEERLFAHLMTKKAFLIGAVNTHFVNASGLPASEHYSTVYDLALIGRYLLSKKVSGEIVGKKQDKFRHPAYHEPLTITNTNGLLGYYEGANGIKTGTANAAGKCLVASAERRGRKLIAVVLKSGDRTGDCVRLLNFGFNDTQRVKVVDQSSPFKQLKVIDGKKPYVDIYPAYEVPLWMGEGTPYIEKRVKLNYSLKAPVLMGEKVGVLEIYADGKQVAEVPLVSSETVKEKNNLIVNLYYKILN